MSFGVNICVYYLKRHLKKKADTLHEYELIALEKAEHERAKEARAVLLANTNTPVDNQLFSDSFLSEGDDFTIRSRLLKQDRLCSKLIFESECMPSLDFDLEPMLNEDSKKSDMTTILRQMQYIVNENLKAEKPFNINISSFDTSSKLSQLLVKGVMFKKNMLSTTEKSYLDLYPREKLVYINYAAKQVMHTFDPAKVYVFGATKGVSNLTMNYMVLECKKRGIECVRLPVKYYVNYTGSTNLNWNEMFKTFLNLHAGHDWAQSFLNSFHRGKTEIKVKVKPTFGSEFLMSLIFLFSL